MTATDVKISTLLNINYSKVIQTIKYVNNIFLKILFSIYIHVHLGSHEIIGNNYIKVLFTQCAIFPFFICAIVVVSLVVVLVVV